MSHRRLLIIMITTRKVGGREFFSRRRERVGFWRLQLWRLSGVLRKKEKKTKKREKILKIWLGFAWLHSLCGWSVVDDDDLGIKTQPRAAWVTTTRRHKCQLSTYCVGSPKKDNWALWGSTFFLSFSFSSSSPFHAFLLFFLDRNSQCKNGKWNVSIKCASNFRPSWWNETRNPKFFLFFFIRHCICSLHSFVLSEIFFPSDSFFYFFFKFFFCFLLSNISKNDNRKWLAGKFEPLTRPFNRHTRKSIYLHDNKCLVTMGSASAKPIKQNS